MSTEKLVFESSKGEKFVVPYLKDALTMKQMRALRKKYKDDFEEMSVAFLKEVLSKDDFERVENLSLRDFEKFNSAWIENEDGGLGE